MIKVRVQSMREICRQAGSLFDDEELGFWLAKFFIGVLVFVTAALFVAYAVSG